MKYYCTKIDKRKIGSDCTKSMAAQFNLTPEGLHILSYQCKQWFKHLHWTEEVEDEFAKAFIKKNKLNRIERKALRFTLLDIGPSYKQEYMCNCTAEAK